MAPNGRVCGPGGHQAEAEIRRNVASQVDLGFLDFRCVLFILLSTASWLVLQFSPNTIKGDQLTFEHRESTSLTRAACVRP